MHYTAKSIRTPGRDARTRLLSHLWGDWCFSPGDDITVYGVVRQRWKPLYLDSRCDAEIVLEANYIEINNDQSTAAVALEDFQKEIEEFWETHKRNPIAGIHTPC